MEFNFISAVAIHTTKWRKPRGWPAWEDQTPPTNAFKLSPFGFQEPSVAAFGPCSELWNLQGLLHGPVCPAMKYLVPFFSRNMTRSVFVRKVAVCLQGTCGKWGKRKVCLRFLNIIRCCFFPQKMHQLLPMDVQQNWTMFRPGWRAMHFVAASPFTSNALAAAEMLCEALWRWWNGMGEMEV